MDGGYHRACEPSEVLFGNCVKSGAYRISTYVVNLPTGPLHEVLQESPENIELAKCFGPSIVVQTVDLVDCLQFVFSTSVQNLLIDYLEVVFSVVQLFFFGHGYGHQALGRLLPPLRVVELSLLAVVQLVNSTDNFFVGQK